MVRERIQSLAKVMAHLESGQFKWNNIYLATTTPAQSYAGSDAFSFGMTKTEFSWEMSKT